MVDKFMVFDVESIGLHGDGFAVAWVVVGVFDSDKTAFDSEIWGDAEQMMAAFRRPVYSTLVLRLNQREALAGLKAAIEAERERTKRINAGMQAQLQAQEQADKRRSQQVQIAAERPLRLNG